MTDRDKLQELFCKRMDGTLSPREEAELDSYLDEYKEEDLTSALEEVFADVTDIDDSYKEHDWETIRQKIVALPHPADRKPSGRFFSSAFFRYAAAAVLLIATGGGAWYYFHSTTSDPLPADPVSQLQHPPLKDIPGDQSCGLVEPTRQDLARDNRIIHLDIHNGVHTLSISPGWQFRTTLPDGSTVVLNAASSVTYPASFKDSLKREVTIKGEVFFDVAQNVRQPFYVKAGGAVLQALGTSFNVNAYGDKDSVYTTLVSGSLKAIKGTDSTMLQPGQQAAIGLKDSSGVKVGRANLSATGMWREGYFSFNESRVEEVMRELGRWYKWEISYAAGAKPASFSGTFCRRTPEAEVLQTLRDKGIRFVKTGNKIILE